MKGNIVLSGAHKSSTAMRLIIGSFFLFFFFISNAQTIVTNGTSVVVSPGTSVNSTHHVTLQAGGTLDNKGTVILKKNLVNENATPDSLGTGLFILSGTTAQVVTGQNIIQNLTIDNTQGVEVGGNTRINGVFTLSNGVVTLGPNHLLLGSAATIAGTPSSSAMVVATDDGELRKEFPSGFTGSFTWPVGDEEATGDYSPVTLNFTSGTFGADNYVGVNVVNGQYPGTAESYLNRYWKVTPSNITNFICAATFQYVPGDVQGTESDVYCFKVAPAPWVAYNPANTGAHQLSASGLDAFSTFTGNKGNGTLPPANRIVQNQTIVMDQSVCFDAQQTITIAGNGTTFTVQDGGNVNLVAGVKILLLPGTRVYAGGILHGYIRTDGTYCTVPGNPVVVNPEENKMQLAGFETAEAQMFRVYPNPTSGKFTLELEDNLVSEKINVEVFGMTGGKIVSQELQWEKKHEFSLDGRPVGVYFVKVVTGGEVKTVKLILTR